MWMSYYRKDFKNIFDDKEISSDSDYEESSDYEQNSDQEILKKIQTGNNSDEGNSDE